MILILTIDTKSENNWEHLKCSHKEIKDFLLKEIQQFDFNLKKFVETNIIKAAVVDNFENSNDNMKIKIQLTLYADKTWSEKAGGYIKTVIHFHINKICRFLEEQLSIEKVTCEWRGDNTSNCKHCMFYKNNKVDDIFAYKKEKNSTIEDCYFSFKDTAREKDFALLKSENRCRNFEPCKSYIESVGSIENLNNFKKLLENSFNEKQDISILLSKWSTLTEKYNNLLKDNNNELLIQTKAELEKIESVLINEHNLDISQI